MNLYVLLSTLALLVVTVHCQRPGRRGSRRRDRQNANRDPLDTLGLGSFDLSQVQDLSQPTPNGESLIQRRERLAAELEALDLALGPSGSGTAGTGRQRGNRRNRQRSGNTGGRRRNRQRDRNVLPDLGHDHSHVDHQPGRLDRGNRRRDRNSGHQNNFDAFLDRVLGPLDSPNDRIRGRGRGRRIDIINDQHNHLDSGHGHSHDHIDIRPGRRRNRQRNRDILPDHAGHDHGSPDLQHGGFDAFLDKVLGPDPALDKTNKKKKPKKKAKNKKKGKKNANKKKSKPPHVDPHDHNRRDRQNRQQQGLRGFLQNLVLGELSRRLTGPRFGPPAFNPFVPRRRVFVMG